MIIPVRWFSLLGLALLAGCQSAPPKDYRPTLARFFLESLDGSGLAVTLPKSEVRLVLSPQPVLTEADIVNVELVQVDLGKCLAFQLTPRAARDCYRMTASHQGRRLVLEVNGEAMGARVIDRPIQDGVVLVFAEVSDTVLPRLVSDLKRSVTDVQRKIERKR